MSARRKAGRADVDPEISELFKSVMAGRIEPVADYLAADGDVDVRARNGMTLLMVAVWSQGREDIVELLLKASPDLSIREPSSDWRAITYAAVNGHVSILHRLLAAGDAIGPNDWKALMFAVQYRSHETVPILLENGADPNIRDNEGRTPLMRAARNSDHPMLLLLLENGADPNIVDDDGMSALMFAAGKANLENVALLLERGADPELRNAEGKSASDIASAAKRPAMVSALAAG